MKNKIVYVIVSLMFIITMIFTSISVKKIYQEKILPVNEKIAIHEKLLKKEKKLDSKIADEINSSKNIQKITKSNQKRQEKLEKKLDEYQAKYSSKVVYLTFDDGPSIYTMDILNTLDKYNVKPLFL